MATESDCTEDEEVVVIPYQKPAPVVITLQETDDEESEVRVKKKRKGKKVYRNKENEEVQQHLLPDSPIDDDYLQAQDTDTNMGSGIESDLRRSPKKKKKARDISPGVVRHKRKRTQSKSAEEESLEDSIRFAQRLGLPVELHEVGCSRNEEHEHHHHHGHKKRHKPHKEKRAEKSGNLGKPLEPEDGSVKSEKRRKRHKSKHKRHGTDQSSSNLVNPEKHFDNDTKTSSTNHYSRDEQVVEVSVNSPSLTEKQVENESQLTSTINEMGSKNETAGPAVVGLETEDEVTIVSEHLKPTCDIFPLKWTVDMKIFYGENTPELDEAAISAKQSNDKSLWHISRDTRRPNLTNKYCCMNCLQRGHTQANCMERVRGQVCRTCGDEGHKDGHVYCPNSLCLLCGRKALIFRHGCEFCYSKPPAKCSICGMEGHVEKLCPDNWRRYYAMTDRNRRNTNETEAPPYKYKAKFRQTCANCGSRTHNYFHCQKPRSTDVHYYAHIPNKPYVIRELSSDKVAKLKPTLETSTGTENEETALNKSPASTSNVRSPVKPSETNSKFGDESESQLVLCTNHARIQGDGVQSSLSHNPISSNSTSEKTNIGHEEVARGHELELGNPPSSEETLGGSDFRSASSENNHKKPMTGHEEVEEVAPRNESESSMVALNEFSQEKTKSREENETPIPANSESILLGSRSFCSVSNKDSHLTELQFDVGPWQDVDERVIPLELLERVPFISPAFANPSKEYIVVPINIAPSSSIQENRSIQNASAEPSENSTHHMIRSAESPDIEIVEERVISTSVSNEGKAPSPSNSTSSSARTSATLMEAKRVSRFVTSKSKKM